MCCCTSSISSKPAITAERLTVKSLIEAAPGVYFPQNADLEVDISPTVKPGSPAFRESYTASEAVANDPAYSDDWFEIKWPGGSRVEDTITGRSYTVEPSDTELERRLQKEVDDAIKATSTAPSQP